MRDREGERGREREREGERGRERERETETGSESERVRDSLMHCHLHSSMGAEKEVKLVGVSDSHVHCGPRWNVATATNL